MCIAEGMLSESRWVRSICGDQQVREHTSQPGGPEDAGRYEVLTDVQS